MELLLVSSFMDNLMIPEKVLNWKVGKNSDVINRMPGE